MSRNIKFKEDWSKNERVFYEMAQLKGIKVTFEPHTIDIIPSTEITSGRAKPTQYTPDFALTYGNKKIIVETKGFMRGRDHIITRLADIYYTAKGIEYYVVLQTGAVKHGNKNFYLHVQKGIAKRGNKTRTFWTLIGAGSANDDKIYKKANLYVSLDIAKEEDRLEAMIADLEGRKIKHTLVVQNSNHNTKKYAESMRKLEEITTDLFGIQNWFDRRKDEEDAEVS